MRVLSSLFTLPLVTILACGGADESTEAAAPAEEVATEEVATEEVATEEVATEEVVAFDAAGTFASTCASCHGATGQGDGAAAAALPVTPADFSDSAFWETRTDDDVANVIANGGASVGKSPLMVPFGAVLGDNVPAMVAYVHTFSAN